MSKSDSSPRPLTGRVVLIALLGFFGVVFGVNGLMMKLAIDTLPGTEVDSPYVASLRYENEIAAARDQQQRDWKVDARLERQPDGLATLRVEARDRNGVPLAGLSFFGRLERPADKRADKDVALAEIGDGVYRGQATGVSAGLWDLVLEGDSTGNRVYLSKNRLVLN
jgi:nitrogen fixation protein FixH